MQGFFYGIPIWQFFYDYFIWNLYLKFFIFNNVDNPKFETRVLDLIIFRILKKHCFTTFCLCRYALALWIFDNMKHSIALFHPVIAHQYIIKSPQYTGGDFMFLYRFVRRRLRRRRRRQPQILVHAITFEQLFGFLSFLAQLLALTCRLPD